MADFAASDQAPASVCIDKVKGSDVYIGIYGLRYGSPVKDQPEVSYTELEFNTATAMGIPRLVFVLDGDSEDHGLPIKALIDREYGDRQDAFLKRVKEAGLTLQRFRNPDDLKGLVERSLRELAHSLKATPAVSEDTTREISRKTFAGRWQVEQNLGTFSGLTTINWNEDGTFDGFFHEFQNTSGEGQRVSRSGIWEIAQANSNSFKLTAWFKDGETWSSTFQVLGPDKIWNTDYNYVAIRLPR
jgi:hypothetical protein